MTRKRKIDPLTKSLLVRGTGNVFRDFATPNADLEQARAILAAKIIGVLGMIASLACVPPKS
jgi:hypothetical protein